MADRSPRQVESADSSTDSSVQSSAEELPHGCRARIRNCFASADTADRIPALTPKDGRQKIILWEEDLPPHPDEVVQKHWYETTVRLRATCFVFFSLALGLALSLGTVTQLFFAVLGSHFHGVSFGLCVGSILVPPMLLVTAVMVDEMLDVGLDAMDLPTFGLFRATLTASLRHWMPSINVTFSEKLLLILFELFPVVMAVLVLCIEGSNGTWYSCMMKGYLLGGLMMTPTLTFVYVLVHIHVDSCSFRGATRAVYFAHMGHLGEFKQVNYDVGEVFASNSDWQPRTRRMATLALAAVATMSLVLVIFAFWQKVILLFLGQMLVTVLLALSLQSFSPQLLGKAFWFTFSFFILLTLALGFGTISRAYQEEEFTPPALGPRAFGYGEPVASGSDLPISFQPPLNAPFVYPICNTYWGNRNMTAANQLGVLDLAHVASASYASHRQRSFALGSMFNGTLLENWQIVDSASDTVSGSWLAVDFPEQKTRVLAIRGTFTRTEMYADLQIYSGVAVLQLFSMISPVLKLVPSEVIQYLLEPRISWLLFGKTDVVSQIFKTVARHQEESLEKGFALVLTGHSLGGALVGAASSQFGIPGLGFSAPGLFYQAGRLDVNVRKLMKSFTVVQPSSDVVPRVDVQRGMIAWIKCDQPNPITCHKLAKTSCELWSACGDIRGRDYRKVCGEWYSERELNE